MALADQTDGTPDIETARQVLRDPLLKVFPAALLGRMIITPYYPLGDDVLRTLIRIRLDKVVERARSVYGVDTQYGDDVVDLILSRCQERESGGRVVDAILTNTVLPKISETFLKAKMDGSEIARLKIVADAADIRYVFES